jgi:hypothetical protein
MIVLTLVLQIGMLPLLARDVDGAVHILTDGKNLEVTCFVACPQINARINSAMPQPPQTQEGNQQQ